MWNRFDSIRGDNNNQADQDEYSMNVEHVVNDLHFDQTGKVLIPLL